MSTYESIAACLIAKDEAAHVGRCITSVRPFVDEVCVYDTGSTDETVEIVEALVAEPGAPVRLTRGEWRHDFAWAREQSFAMAASDWLLWLDADDEVHGGETLRELCAAAAVRGRKTIFVLYDTHDRGWIWRDRIVRRDSGRWEGQVHEHYRAAGSFHERSLVAHPDAFRIRHRRRRERPGHYLGLIRRAADDPARTPRALHLLAKELMAIAAIDKTPVPLSEAAAALERYLAEGHDRVEGEPNTYRADALQRLMSVYGAVGRVADYDRTVEAWNEYVVVMREAVENGLMPDPTFFKEINDFARAWKPNDTRPEDILLDVDPFKDVKAARNDPCPCQSGKKYKKCHGALA